MLIPISLWWIEQCGWNLTKDKGLLELDSNMLLFFPLIIDSKLNVTLDLELLLLLVTLRGIACGHKFNLLFFRESLSSSLNEDSDGRCDRVDALEKFEYFLIDSFDSNNRIMEDRLEKNRSILDLRDEGHRSFKEKVAVKLGY